MKPDQAVSGSVFPHKATDELRSRPRGSASNATRSAGTRSQGLYLWRSPFGATYLVTNAGTQDLGENEFADAVWRAADPCPQTTGSVA
jgi:hypothetical protein